MKIRTDLTAFSLTGLVVVAIVALVLAGHEVPELLTTIALVSLGVSGGAAAPVHLSGATVKNPTPAEANALAGALADSSSPAGYGLTGVLTAPAKSPAPSTPTPRPGRDMTETFPAITLDQIAADRAAQ